jgi:hypothetical protein
MPLEKTPEGRVTVIIGGGPLDKGFPRSTEGLYSR